MANRKDDRLVPQEKVPVGREAIYVEGEPEGAAALEEPGLPCRAYTDDAGRTVEEWSTWGLEKPDADGHFTLAIEHLNRMEEALGPLDEPTRRIRAHVASLVPCDNGLPVAVDELLDAIGRGRLREPSFHNGCWYCGMWWETRGTQPGQVECMAVVEEVLRGYLAGEPAETFLARHPHAAGFIRRTYEWLGPRDGLTEVRELLLARVLLPFEFLTKRTEDHVAVDRDCFGEGGRGRALDAEIARRAGLPPVHPDYTREFREARQAIDEPAKRDLYRLCAALAHGLHGLSDCHHAVFRWLESWVHAIGTGEWAIPTRRAGTERERLGRLLFGYALGLDAWLLGEPEHWLLLDLGHTDLGFDPKNEIVRVYAYLGAERTPVRTWLAACLWRQLLYCAPRQGLVRGGHHRKLLERAEAAGVSLTRWMDAELGEARGTKAAGEA